MAHPARAASRKGGSTVANRFLRRMRWTTVAGAAQLVSASGLLALAFASPDSAHLPHILPSLLVLGLGTMVGAVAFNVAAGKDIDAGDKGAGYGCTKRPNTRRVSSPSPAVAGMDHPIPAIEVRRPACHRHGATVRIPDAACQCS